MQNAKESSVFVGSRYLLRRVSNVLGPVLGSLWELRNPTIEVPQFVRTLRVKGSIRVSIPSL